jgi:PIN domain nuclease of toxin-antitoxin system
MNLLLDTHTFIWFFNGDATLTRSTRKLINQAIQNKSLYLAAISLWEVRMLETKQRIILEMPCLEWLNRAIEKTYLQITPFTPAIAVESCHLPDGFHGDPTDCLIVATARVENLTILTRDSKILAYGKKKLVATLKA